MDKGKNIFFTVAEMVRLSFKMFRTTLNKHRAVQPAEELNNIQIDQ